MNYTVVVNMAVWIGALTYFYVDARKWFVGPKVTLSLDDLSPSQEKELQDEGLDMSTARKMSHKYANSAEMTGKEHTELPDDTVKAA
jgi:hypothetical protein